MEIPSRFRFDVALVLGSVPFCRSNSFISLRFKFTISLTMVDFEERPMRFCEKRGLRTELELLPSFSSLSLSSPKPLS